MKASILVCVLAVLIILTIVPHAQASVPRGKAWAVIICGSYRDFNGEAAYLYTVLTSDYQFDNDHIYYLSGDTTKSGVDGIPTKNNVKMAFQWLSFRSTKDDLVFIYILCHGNGYNLANCSGLKVGEISGCIDENGDEGAEVFEGTYGKDVNGDGDKNDWFGVDESISLNPYNDEYYREYFLDDELAEWLSPVNYWRLIVVYVGVTKLAFPVEEHCYSGGIIDDLSGPNRIIISPTNETYPSWGKFDPIYDEFGNWVAENTYPISFWGEAFISALDKDTDSFREADVNKDGLVSFLEAFNYAYEHDPLVQGWEGTRYTYVGMSLVPVYEVRLQETPWLDDNGNGLPTFKMGQDFLDTEEGTMADGFLASYTFLDKPCSPDINEDGIVDMADISFACGAWLSKPGDIRWNPAVDFDGNSYINIIDIARMARWYGQTTEP